MTRRGEQRPRRPRSYRFVAGVLAIALVGACGGGGGGGGSAPPPPSGAVAGTILLPRVAWGTIAEQEPNDTPAQAQVLPPIEPDGRLVVAGDGSADGSRTGVVDTTDAFRVLCHRAQDFVLTLTASSGGVALGQFDLAAIDAATGLPIASAATAANPEILSFSLAGETPVDLVVTCAFGAGAYTLEIATATPPIPLARVATGAVALVSGTTFSSAAVEYAFADPDFVPQRVLVRVNGARESADEVARSIGGHVVRALASGTWVVGVPSACPPAGAREPLAWSARLAARADVLRAEPDAVVRALGTTDDPFLGEEWNLDAIGATSAWDVTLGDPSVVVGILDSGVVAHPDLDAQRVGGYDFVSDPSVAADGGGRDPDPTDPGARDQPDGTSAWHGSHVAGIAVARANGAYGVVGVAPGCRFMPLRVVGVGGGATSDLADALRYAAGLAGPADAPPMPKPLRVVNMSIGTSSDVAEIHDAVKAAASAGVLLVASAGNDGGPVLFPAAYPEVIGVGAVDGRLVHASYSNFGPSLALVAPGGNDDRDVAGDGFPDGVLSTVLDETLSPPAPGWRRYSGTSMAAPHVAAAAALLFSVDPALTASQARDALLSTCRDLSDPGRDDATGAGLLQVGEAVRRVLANKGTPRLDPPRLLLSSTSVRVHDGEGVVTVDVDNGGGGLLAVTAVTTSTDTGAAWLHAFTTTAPLGSPSLVSQIVVFVDRTGLAPGLYAGTVFVRSGLATLGSLRVLLEVGPSSPFLGNPVTVVLRRASTGAVIASTTAFPETGYRYAFDGVAAGDYVIRAGTDIDRNGFFCQTGDGCADTATFHVADGERREGLDVELAMP